jgi:ADP-ribosylarginine hydrolase
MTTLKEKINASFILGSYLDTLGFKNGEWEFNFNQYLKTIPDAIQITYEIIHNFFALGGFNIDISKWKASDDTIMMIATRKACIKGATLKNFIDEYIKILPALEDQTRVSGISTLKSLRILKKTKNPKNIIYDSSMGGNGAAMRTHYIGIHFNNDIKNIIKVSIMASRLTHNYPLGFLSGMSTALFTNYAINNIEPWKWCNMLIELEENGTIDSIMKETDIYDKYIKDKDEFWKVWYKYREERANRFHIKTSEFIYGIEKLDHYIKILYNDENKVDLNRFGGSGVSAVIIAYDCILCSIYTSNVSYTREIDLSDTKNIKYSWNNLIISSTLNFWDNDTIGAICGMLFGALRGYDGVNKNIINMLEFKKELDVYS